MKLNMRAVFVVFVLSSAAYTAYAENVTISTYYPSPYGSYQTLETNTLQGAAGTGNVAMVPTGGNVGIRNGASAPTSLLDIGNSTLAASAMINVNAAAAQQTGINFQSAGTSRWSMYRPASSTDLRFWDGTADQVTFANGGNVGIGTAPGAYKLNVNGTANIQGTIRTRDTSTSCGGGPCSGNLQVSCDNTNCYAYAVYS